METGDCPIYQYCGGGACIEFKKAGEACTHKNQCGRTSTCWFKNSASNQGTCTEYMQIENSDANNPVYHYFGSTKKFEDDSHLLCKSLYFDKSTGICGKAPKSTKKGEKCLSDTGCPSDKSGINGACKCGWNDKGDKFCDILEGDEEYDESRRKFKEYYEATKDTCSAQARWAPCSNSKEYWGW